MFSLCSVPPMVVVVVNLTGTTTHCGGAAAPPTFAGACPPVTVYDTWANMLNRVRGNSERNKKWYRDKGITVCPEWLKFEGFRDWALAAGYREGLSLDRLRTLGNYEPKNCEWVSRSENSRRAAQDVWRKFNDAAVVNGLMSFGA